VLGGFAYAFGMSPVRLRLVTFNIAHGRGLNPIQGLTTTARIRRNLRGIARLLCQLNADIAAFQEIDYNSSWAGGFDHLKYLSYHSAIPNQIFGINNRRHGLLNLSYGNALLSRTPILASETVVFGNKHVGEKGFLYVELSLKGKVLPLVNVHLHYRSRHQRMRQLDKLTEFLHVRHEQKGRSWLIPPIVCGDFNTPHHGGDAATNLFSRLHQFCDYRYFPLDECTFPSPWPSRTLDFVFLPRKCRHVNAAVVQSILSDHCPVLVEFEV